MGKVLEREPVMILTSMVLRKNMVMPWVRGGMIDSYSGGDERVNGEEWMSEGVKKMIRSDYRIIFVASS